MNELEQEKHMFIQSSAMEDIIALLKKKNVHPMDAIPALGASLEHILTSIADQRGWNSVKELVDTFCFTLRTNIDEAANTTTFTIKAN